MVPALTVLSDFLRAVGDSFSVTLLEHPSIISADHQRPSGERYDRPDQAWAFGIVITIVGAYHGFKVEEGQKRSGIPLHRWLHQYSS